MIAEIEKTGTLHVSGFYLRRILRLLPGLLFYMAVFIPTLFYLGAEISLPQIASGVFYFANYYHIFMGYPPYSPMPILWSLSVEEHFYILFPFVLLAFRAHLKAALIAIGCALIAGLLWRITLYHLCAGHAMTICGLPDRIRVQGTDAIFDCILYGSFTALLLHYHPKEACRIFIHNKALALAAAFLLASIAIRAPGFRETLRYSMQSACIAVIMANILLGEAGFLKRMFESAWMVRIGKLSYSLYLMHFGALIAIEAAHGTHHLRNIADTLLYFALSFMLACCSYFLIEMPMSAIRHKFPYVCPPPLKS
jgi:peptidoglycan/LPS O-acetylase OafA/YrhL